jgi:hypothetical protein
MVFYATSVEDEKYKKLEVIERDMRLQSTLLDYLKPLFIEDGVYPIYNRIGEIRQQIVNVPEKIMSSDDILEYINTYTILPQENPPWNEIIYKLRCYSKVLTEEYFDRVGFSLDKNRKQAESETGIIAELDKDAHYFVCCPKEDEGKISIIFHLKNPNKPRRNWIILNEVYDYVKNAWVKGEWSKKGKWEPSSKISKRENHRVEPATEKKKENTELLQIAKAKAEFYQTHEKPKTTEFNWKKLEIHPLAHLIPEATIEEQEAIDKSVEKNGVYEPLWLYEGKILDGRHRFKSALKYDKKPEFRAFKGPGSARSFVHAMGDNRRHLSKSQRAAIAVDQFLEEYEALAQERLKTNMNGVNSKSKNMNSMHSQKVDYAKKGRACELLSRDRNVNHAYIFDCKSIKEKSPETLQKIISGKLTISKAKAQLFPKKKKKSYKFEKIYKGMLNKVLNLPYRGHEDIYRKMSKIYLKWNKRNDKKMIAELNDISDYCPDLFNNKPKLELITNNNESELMEM